MYLSFIRSIKEAFKGISRNALVSIAAIGIMILSLYIISFVYVANFTMNGILKNIQQRINVSVYLKSDVPESDIMIYKSEIEKSQGNIIKSVQYISREDALEDFKRNNANEPTIIKSLEEIGDNPLLASLVIRTNDSSQYPEVVSYLENVTFKDDISRINYEKNKERINKLNGIVGNIKKSGTGLGILFLVIAMLITFSTISLTIHTRKDEVDVMRLVGASNTFIRLPFIFEGIIFGLVASIISMALLFVSIKYGSTKISSIIPAQSLLNFYLENFLKVFLLQAVIGIALGVLGSLIAIRKHLKV